MEHLALIVAGGTGSRMGESIPKQILPLKGVPIIVHTLKRFLSFDSNLFIGVVLHETIYQEWEALSAKWFSDSETQRLLAIPGGASRTESVHNGLRALHSLTEKAGFTNPLVAIHDAVRPFVSQEMIARSFEMARQKGSAVIAVQVKSSMRRKLADGSVAIDRSEYHHVQTPQVFPLDLVLSCYQQTQAPFTDDASLVESQGHGIFLCEGSYDNIKITTPEDMVIAEGILQRFSDI